MFQCTDTLVFQTASPYFISKGFQTASVALYSCRTFTIHRFSFVNEWLLILVFWNMLQLFHYGLAVGAQQQHITQTQTKPTDSSDDSDLDTISKLVSAKAVIGSFTPPFYCLDPFSKLYHLSLPWFPSSVKTSRRALFSK